MSNTLHRRIIVGAGLLSIAALVGLTVQAATPQSAMDAAQNDAERARLTELIAQRLPVTPPPGGHSVAPHTMCRPGPVLFQTTELAPLADRNGQVTLTVPLEQAQNVALTLRFDDAAFGGTQVRCVVNGHELPPYLAFGGDTRYDNVKDNPDLNPPIARIEANWVLPAAWAGDRLQIQIINEGPGSTEPAELIVSRVDAHNAPRYQNPIYASMDLWQWQGSYETNAEEEWWNNLILGQVPSSRARVLHHRNAEDIKVGYDAGQVSWYMMWHFYYDHDSHYQAIQVSDAPDAKPVELRTRDGMRQCLAAWMRQQITPAGSGPGNYISWDYVDMMVMYLEQSVPEWALDGRYTDQGYTPLVWAEAWCQSQERVMSLLRERAPWVKLHSELNFAPPAIHWYYRAAAQALGHPLRDRLDTLDDHTFGSHFPVVALHLNRFRLGRTAKNLKVGDPLSIDVDLPAKMIVGANGWFDTLETDANAADLRAQDIRRRFDYDVGCAGDEMVSNSETSAWGPHFRTLLQGDDTVYRHLYGLIAYTLLPTGQSEPREIKEIRLMGDWVAGPIHTKRLRTRDPHFGDLFGYNHWQYCASHTYGGMRGPKSREARIGQFDAFAAMRRAALAGQLDGPVFPVQLNDPDSRNLVIKAITGHFNWQPMIELAAVNYDQNPHPLDVSLYVGHNEPVQVLVLDDRAAYRWDAKPQTLQPVNGELRYQATIPPLGAWQVLIFDEGGRQSRWTGAPATPQPQLPQFEADLAQVPVTLTWSGDSDTDHYVVQLGSEALFAEKHLLYEASVSGTEFVVPNRLLVPQTRTWWRVQAVTADGRASDWSPPRPYCFQWPARVAAMNQWRAARDKRIEGSHQRLAMIRETEQRYDLTNEDNAVARATLASAERPSGPFILPPGAAVDFRALTYWDAAGDKPSTWSIQWDQPQTISTVRIYWLEDDSWISDGQIGRNGYPASFRVQAWIDDAWQTVAEVKDNDQAQTVHVLSQPVRTTQLRLDIDAAPGRAKIGIRELRVE